MKAIRLTISLGLLLATLAVGVFVLPRNTRAEDGQECNCTDGWTGHPGLIYWDQGYHCRPDGCYIITEVQ